MRNLQGLLPLIMILLALAAGGFYYGWHWKQVADGSKLTSEEEVILSLMRKIDALEVDNKRLMKELREAKENPSSPENADEPASPVSR